MDVYKIKISVKWNFVTTQNYLVIQSTALWQMMLLKKQLAPNQDSGIYLHQIRSKQIKSSSSMKWKQK